MDEDVEEGTSSSVQDFRPNEVGPTKARQRLSQTSEEETPEEETPEEEIPEEEESTGNEEPSKKKKPAMTPKHWQYVTYVRRQTAPQSRSPISGPSISNNNHDSGTMYNEDFGNTYNSTFSTMGDNNSRRYVLPRRKLPRTKRRPGDVRQELTVKSSCIGKGEKNTALSGDSTGDDSDPPIEEVIERGAIMHWQEPTADDCVIEERSAEDKSTQADDDGESHADCLSYESLEMENSPPIESTEVFWLRPHQWHHRITAKVYGLNFETQLSAAFTNVGYRGRFRIQANFNQSTLLSGMLEEEIYIILDNDLQVSEDKVYTNFAAVLAPFSGVVYTPRQVYSIPVDPLTGDVLPTTQGPVRGTRLGLGATAAKSDIGSAESGEASRGPGVEAKFTYSGRAANNKTTTNGNYQARRGGGSGGPDDDDSDDNPHGSPKVPGGGLPKGTASHDRHRFHNDDDDHYDLHHHHHYFHFDQRYSTSPTTTINDHRYSTSTANIVTDYRHGHNSHFYEKQQSEYDTDNKHPKEKRRRRHRSPL